MVTTGRPAPLREAARLWGLVIGAASAVIASLVTAGSISADQGSLLEGGFTKADLVISAVVGLVTWGSTAAAAFSTAKTGEAAVTPVVSPRDHQGRILVPAAPRADPGVSWVEPAS